MSNSPTTTSAGVYIYGSGRIELKHCDDNRCLDALHVGLEHVGTGLLVTLVGALNESTALSLRQVLSWPAGTREPRMYLNLENLWTIDIGGMEMLDELCEHHDAHVIRPSAAYDALRGLVA